MTKVKRWTAEEERVLTDQMTRNANNFAEAFRKTSELIDRTPSACTYHWYGVMSKRGDVGVIMSTIGYKTVNVNRKIVSASTSDNTEKVTVSWWKKFLSFLGKKK